MSGNHRKGSDIGAGKSMKKNAQKMPISLSHFESFCSLQIWVILTYEMSVEIKTPNVDIVLFAGLWLNGFWTLVLSS